MKIPTYGLPRRELRSTLASYREGDLPWRNGRTYAYVYDAGREAEEVGAEVYSAFLGENGLDPTAFPSLLRLENEVLGMAASHLGGDEVEEPVVGSFTSGGTESIILAVKSARDWARIHRPDVGRPEILLPVTAHAAFHKAAHYLGLDKVLVAVDGGFRASPAAMAKAITERTILMVGSAPSYAHGVVDPIEALAGLALERGLLFHVDACVGGFLLPYFRRLGQDVPDFDFRVPGVTSISMDLHKYAFCPKGASVVLYRRKELRRHQIFACAEWSGYTVVNLAVQSSKTGGPVAAAWAVMRFLGDEGYLEIARQTLDGTRRLLEGIRAIDGLEVLGSPDFCMVAAAASAPEELSVFHVVDEMVARGWCVQPQFSFEGSPANIHFSVNPGNAAHVNGMIEDLRRSVEAACGRPSGQLAAMAKAAFAGGVPDQLDPETFTRLLAIAGVQGTQIPERMAEINEVLDALPRSLTAQLLVAFLNELFVPPEP